MKRIGRVIIISSLAACTVSAGNYLSWNFGLAASKSILGISYLNGLNEINMGLKGFQTAKPLSYHVQPGITYNRYFGENGFYASFTFAPTYKDDSSSDIFLEASNSNQPSSSDNRSEEWGLGSILLGAGKSFQGQAWGLSFDAGFALPTPGNDQQYLGYWIGCGTSYRFKVR